MSLGDFDDADGDVVANATAAAKGKSAPDNKLLESSLPPKQAKLFSHRNVQAPASAAAVSLLAQRRFFPADAAGDGAASGTGGATCPPDLVLRLQLLVGGTLHVAPALAALGAVPAFPFTAVVFYSFELDPATTDPLFAGLTGTTAAPSVPSRVAPATLRALDVNCS